MIRPLSPPAERPRLCLTAVAWISGAGVRCGQPAKMAGGVPYCVDHFPAVVS